MWWHSRLLTPSSLMLNRAVTSLALVLLLNGLALAEDLPVDPPPVESPAFPGLFWVNADALLWWMRPAHLPPLVTASPPGTPVPAVGVLGAPGTAVLFGGS